MFHIEVSVWEKAIRTAAVYGAILTLLRFAGKRSLASLNSFDLVVLLLLSNVVQNAIIGADNSLVGGLLGALILIVLNWSLVRLTYMHPLATRVLQGTPTTLYAHGSVQEANLHRELITRQELVAALRRQGMELDEIHKVDLEPDGALNATPIQPEQGDKILELLERVARKLDA
jgi:uncharacterized membrane protein YcaP (DUF421 family)